MPAGYDAEVAELFRDLRSASGLSEADLAAQLATRPEVVQALEQGALYALPPWPETYRVVATYGTLLNLDVRPLLRRIYAQVDAGVVGLAPKSMPDVPFMAPPESIGREFQGQAPVSAPRAPHAAPNRQPPARQAQAPQSRPQPQQNSQPLPQQQPQWSPQPRGAPPPQRGAPPLPSQQPRPMPPPPREARAPSPPHQPQPRSPLAPRAAPLEENPPRKAFPWKTIIKWGVVALVIVGIAAGVWMWLAKPSPLGPGSNPGQPGAKSSNKGAPTDPNDPRSRKADRLPGPS